MQKLAILFLLLTVFQYYAYAQGNTNFGTSSGIAGTDNSYFGNSAGSAAGSSSSQNVGIGRSALSNNSSGSRNTAVGFESLFNNNADGNSAVGYYSLRSNTTGTHNAAFGYASLYLNTTGSRNTAMGDFALRSNTTASYNTAVGYYSLYANTTGEDNTAIGYTSLRDNTTGARNTAIGKASLYANTTGNDNTAVGYLALSSNTSGFQNTSLGAASLWNNTTGSYNSAIGSDALRMNTTGNSNVGFGLSALWYNKTGSYNVALGLQSLYNTNGNSNVGIGSYALYNSNLGYNNTAIGANADVGESPNDYHNSTAIGAYARATGSNQVRIGSSSVTSIGGYAPWSNFSDGRFKKDVKEDVAGLSFIQMLKPVSYLVDKNSLDKFLGIPDSVTVQRKSARTESLRETGFIAQEVEQVIKKTGVVFSGVGVPANEHDHYTLKYSQFVVPLVKAVQELSQKVEDQKINFDAREQHIKEQKQQISLLLSIGSTDQHKTGSSASYLLDKDPNSVAEPTHIKMVVSDQSQQANLMIYNLEGKQIKSMVIPGRGNTEVTLSAHELTGGIYIYTLIADGQIIDTKRMILTE